MHLVDGVSDQIALEEKETLFTCMMSDGQLEVSEAVMAKYDGITSKIWEFLASDFNSM